MNSPSSVWSGRNTRLRDVLWVVIPIIVWNVGFPALLLGGWNVQVENGLMENLQVAFLLIGGAWFILSARRSATGERVLYAGMVVLYLTFLVLEVDLRRYDLPVLNLLLNGVIRDIWLGGLWVLAFIWFLTNWRAAWQAFIRWLRTPGALFLIAAGGLWAASAVVDKLNPIESPSLNLFVEELLEINATWLMLASAVLTWRRRSATKNLPSSQN